MAVERHFLFKGGVSPAGVKEENSLTPPEDNVWEMIDRSAVPNVRTELF